MACVESSFISVEHISVTALAEGYVFTSVREYRLEAFLDCFGAFL